MQKQKKVNQFQRAQNRIQQLLPGFCGSYWWKKNLSITTSKKIASDKGIQLNQVKGSGENGRIIKSDIENFTLALQSGGTGQKTLEVYRRN
jgi:pyruvate/2-oxoglutarate dehydrogenase complex dihydrolipoamide acyltransferase (E2) component